MKQTLIDTVLQYSERKKREDCPSWLWFVITHTTVQEDDYSDHQAAAIHRLLFPTEPSLAFTMPMVCEVFLRRFCESCR